MSRVGVWSGTQMGRRGAAESVSRATFGQATSLVGAITLLLSAVPVSPGSGSRIWKGVLSRDHGSPLPILYPTGPTRSLAERVGWGGPEL